MTLAVVRDIVESHRTHFQHSFLLNRLFNLLLRLNVEWVRVPVGWRAHACVISTEEPARRGLHSSQRGKRTRAQCFVLSVGLRRSAAEPVEAASVGIEPDRAPLRPPCRGKPACMWLLLGQSRVQEDSDSKFANATDMFQVLQGLWIAQHLKTNHLRFRLGRQTGSLP